MTNTEQRRKDIYELICRHSYAGVSELSSQFNVTTATIRTDLQALEDDGKVIRSHGGAIPAGKAVLDLHEDIKSKTNVPQKKRIASAAAKLVGADDSILIASGSTMVYFAEALHPAHHLNVVTPSVRIAIKLITNPAISVMQLGGIIYANTLSTRGTYAESGLDYFHCSKFFFGVEGFDVTSGLTCATIEEANLTSKMLKSASQSIVLADSSKFGRKGFGRICSLEDIDVLITDSGLSEDSLEMIQSCGVKVIVV